MLYEARRVRISSTWIARIPDTENVEEILTTIWLGGHVHKDPRTFLVALSEGKGGAQSSEGTDKSRGVCGDDTVFWWSMSMVISMRGTSPLSCC